MVGVNLIFKIKSKIAARHSLKRGSADGKSYFGEAPEDVPERRPGPTDFRAVKSSIMFVFTQAETVQSKPNVLFVMRFSGLARFFNF